MRFFKSCRRMKQPRAREMLFLVVFGSEVVTAHPRLAPGRERPLQKKAPENSEPEANP